MANLNKEELELYISTTGDDNLRLLAQAELQKLTLMEQAAGGDELANALLALKDVVDVYKQNNQQAIGSGGANVSKDEIEKLVKTALNNTKIAFNDLDAELKARLAGSVKIQLSLNLPQTSFIASSQTLMEEFAEPLFQKILSDWKARNNIYLFGAAGTGKTFIAGLIADFLGFEKIEINCNQFTSPLDLVGGQTIDGYQKGKLEMAWTNIGPAPMNESYKGVVLLLDELPKLDPNTAGLLNSALAKVKEFKGKIGPYILNGKGDKLELKNILIIGTGNVRLNETSIDYEANFKQDLSLQDRFSGSTYEVNANYDKEFNKVLKGFAFIWIYMTKLRELIIENRMSDRAFVSYRILIALKDTYIIYRDIEAQKIIGEISLTQPKTVIQGVNSFLNLFKPNQIELLKLKSNYDEFLTIVEQKNKRSMSDLDTQEELEEGQRMVLAYNKLINEKIA